MLFIYLFSLYCLNRVVCFSQSLHLSLVYFNKCILLAPRFNGLIAGGGSSGWQAPEQLVQGRQTRAVDIFNLGCILFFCMTGGKHPFGQHLERDINIVKNRKNLFLVQFIPEAEDLISCLLNPDPNLR